MAKRRSKSEVVRDRRLIADLYLAGKLQIEIAAEVGISQTTVSKDLQALQEEWRQSSLVDIDTKKAEELARVDRLEREYWQAWRRSCEDAETETQKAVQIGEGIARKEAIKRAEGQSGDPRFLAGVQWCIERRCRILGIDAPEKHQIAGDDEHPMTIILKRMGEE